MRDVIRAGLFQSATFFYHLMKYKIFLCRSTFGLVDVVDVAVVVAVVARPEIADRIEMQIDLASSGSTQPIALFPCYAANSQNKF